MKKVLIGALLLGTSSLAMAEAPGGPDCGWGNMLFKGQSGLGPHVLASITNASTYNASLGMTSGTNGCSVNGTLTYGGKSMIGLNGVLDEFIVDAANGQGEALTAVAVSMGIQPEDRPAFAAAIHNNFNQIFPSTEVTAAEVETSIINIMKNDPSLSKYVS